MNKFNLGDKCRVIKNALDPLCVGYIVTIKEVLTSISGKIFYKIQEEEIEGYAEEACLELVKEHNDYKL